MSIINRGVFDSGTAFLRQVGNDWPRAQVITTAEIIESSSNLYFTNVRVVQTVTPLLTTANVVETTNQYFTNARVLSALIGSNVLLNNLTANNLLANSLIVTGNVTFGSGTGGSITGLDVLNTSSLIVSNTATLNNLIVSGDLEVQGNTVTLNVATLNVEDKNILLANGAATSSAADGAGILIAGAQANITYSNTGDKFVINKNTDFTGNVVADAIVSNGDVIATGNIITRDVRATGNLVANGLIIRNINVSDSILTGNIITASTTSNVIVADSITANIWGGLYTANVVESANALYYTNSRVRSAFSAGKGITITTTGTIINTGALPDYNTTVDGTGYGNVSSTMSNVVTFPSLPISDRFVLRSIHVTNTTDSTTLLSSNVLYATGNTAGLTNRMPVPAGASLELIDKNQLFGPGDVINLQGFNASGTATANLMTYALTYETFNLASDYNGSGTTLALSNTNIQIYDTGSAFSIIEGIKVVNLMDNVVPVKLWWADANGLVKAFYIHNFPVPPNSSVEILQKTKRINQTDKLYASYTGANASAISVFISARLGVVYTAGIQTSSAIPGNAIIASFRTTEADGTPLYYTIE